MGGAGFVGESRSGVVCAPKVRWRTEPVARQVEDRTGRPVVVGNDGKGGAWGEGKLGAGRGHDHLMMITIGTGIGGALVLNGELYRGRWGMAGEPGHYRVVPDGRLCGCGNRGCWEQYASGSALVAEARDFARRSPGAAVPLLQLSGGTPEGITGLEVMTAAREGDAAPLRCFDIIGRWVGGGLADKAPVVGPPCLVPGGGGSEAGG